MLLKITFGVPTTGFRSFLLPAVFLGDSDLQRLKRTMFLEHLLQLSALDEEVTQPTTYINACYPQDILQYRVPTKGFLKLPSRYKDILGMFDLYK